MVIALKMLFHDLLLSPGRYVAPFLIGKFLEFERLFEMSSEPTVG